MWLSPTNDERGMVARQVASRIGDLLTVNISESTDLTTNGLAIAQTGQTNPIQSEFFRMLTQAMPGAFRLGRDANGDPISVDLAALFAGNYDGGVGSIDTDMSIAQVALTVHVIDVLPNGNLIVEGGKAISIAEETQFAILRGIVRPIDVADDNTIPSSRVASASIEFIGEGALSDVQRKNWLTRILENVNPF